MDQKTAFCIELLRTLVSDIQGAPFRIEGASEELYAIWYEHAQRDAAEAFGYLDENFKNQEEIDRALNSMLK